MNDHDLTMQHENQLNGPDGLAGRVNDIESWKNDYLQNDRKISCLGLDAVEKLREELKKEKENDLEMTKVKVSNKGLILVALISSIIGPGFMLFLAKLMKI